MTHCECRWARLLFVFLWLASSGVLAAEEALSPEAVTLLEHLEPLWDGMRSDVVSFDIEYQLFMQVKPDGEWPRDKVLAALQRHDLAQGVEQIPALFKELATKSKPVAIARHLQKQGSEERYSVGKKTILMDETVSLIAEEPRKLLRALDRGREGEGYYSIEYFRVPTKTREGGLRASSVERNGDLVTIGTKTVARDGVTIETFVDLDWATGVVLHRRSLREGVLYREMDYSGITTFPGNLTIPRVVTTLNYANGFLKSMDLVLLGAAQFNMPLPKETFELTKPADWVALDYRGNAAGTKFDLPPQDIANIRTVIPSQPLEPFQVTDTKFVIERSPWRRALLAINGVVFLGVAVWFWRRGGSRESTK